LADAILCKIENSTDILNDLTTPEAKEIVSMKEKIKQLPQIIESTGPEIVRDMFDELGQEKKSNGDTENKPTEAPLVKESIPKDEKGLENKKQPEYEQNTTEKYDKDNPVIDDEDKEDDEEEIITTTKPVNEDKEEAEARKNDIEKSVENFKHDSDEAEYANDQFKAPWENLEVALTIFERTKSSYYSPDEFEQDHWNLKADILERQADLEIAREQTKEGIDLYLELIDLCIKHK